MQYTTHYNLNLPEGTDIVNPLIQDNPNYSAIDTALYNNKLRVIGNATHVKTGTNHAITLADSDIVAFKFVATGDYATGDTFTVDGVTVTARVADGSTIPNGAFKINSTVEAVIDGTILNLINVYGTASASGVSYDNTSSGLNATNVQSAINEIVQSSGWQDLTNLYLAKYIKKGFAVELVISILNDAGDIPSQTAVPIGTLPIGFRPSFPIYAPAVCGSTGAETGYIYVNTNGVVNVVNSSPNIQRYLSGNITFIV